MKALAKRLLVLLLIIAGNTAAAQKDTLVFTHITDLHAIFNQPGYPAPLMEYRKARNYDKAEERLREFLQTVPDKTKCDLVIATGDLVDFFEAGTANERMLSLQAEQFAQLIDEYQVPVFVTLGNHDIFSFEWKDEKLKHDQNSAGRSRAAWIRNMPCLRDGTYYPETFKAGDTNYRLLFLDNGFYQFNPGDSVPVPYIDKAQLYWLNEQLSRAGADPVIILMHIPFNPAETGKDNELFSALIGNPSVKLILAGHNHKNAVDIYSAPGHQMIQVQTRALVNGETNWRLVSLTENNILVTLTGGIGNELIIPVK